MRRAFLASLVSLLVVTATPAGATTVEELRARVAEARRLATEASSAPTRAAMDRVRAALGLPDQIVIQGRRVNVPADPALARLEGGSAEDFRQAVRHLDVLSSRLEATPSPVDQEGLRADLRAAYGTRTQDEPSLIDRVRALIGSFFRWLEGEADRALGGVPGLILLVLVTGVAIALLARRRAFSVVPEAAADRDRGARAPEQWRRLAREARARGDLGEAVTCLYRALVAELAARGLVDDHPSLTARELRLATALSARLAAPMAEASRRYERVRYGGDVPTHDDVASLERAERAARSA